MNIDGIDAFWAWWPSARGKIEAAIGGNGFDDALVADINEHVSAIEADLDWELSPGRTAQHAFCMSAKGDPEGRLVAEIWRHKGPAVDATWEYHAARLGGPVRAGMTLEIDDLAVELADFVVAFEVDAGRERVDATYFHPEFPKMAENLRATVTFLMLDGAFGEDGVERWLGNIEVADDPPDGARPIMELQAAVEKLAAEATGEKFAVLRGEDDGGAPVFITVNQALKRVDHLLACMHVAIDLAILEPTEQGLTSNAEADVLNTLEDELVTALAGSAHYYGRETRRGRRVLHLFAPEDGPAASVIQRWSTGHVDRDIQTTWARDPSWEVQRRFS
ncbi:MAG: DUF695 domain-containing protein [Kofleriaceae bacterium]